MGVEGHVLERLCDTVDWMDGALRPTAADRVAAGAPVVAALAAVDRERAILERRIDLPLRHVMSTPVAVSYTHLTLPTILRV